MQNPINVKSGDISNLFTAAHSTDTPPPLRKSIFLSASLVIAIAIFLPSISVATTLQELKQIELEKLEKGVSAQKKIESLDDQRLQLTHQYRIALNQKKQLEKYNENLSDIVVSQKNEADILRDQIGRVGDLEKNIVPLMSDMIDALENFIALDQPFLLDKRQQRIVRLRSLFSDSNVSNAEKYRRVLEAYQIENDYGLTIESYEGALLNSSSDNQRVNFLKIGRVAYLYQTVDGKESFRWSKENTSWEKLSDNYNSEITKGIRMAKEQIPSNLLLMPILAP
ncbi:MAG: DUF3450 domain-containing protein [Cellvibrionaceae bacterium]